MNFNVKKMSKLMINIDIAISSGGSIFYKSAVTKILALVLLQTENQVRFAEKLNEEISINLRFEVSIKL
jgi:spore coat polysaccharide biosynthesis predicted glycosyltransferase SpsG